MKVKVVELGNIITGNTPSKKTQEFYDSNDIGFIKPDTISDTEITLIKGTNEYISERARTKSRVVQPGAVFVTCIGTIGKIGISCEHEFAFNQQINAIIPNDKVISKYLAYNLFSQKHRLADIANAPVVPIINKTQFSEFTIDIDEDIEKQKKVVETLDNVCHIINARKQELQKLDELIKARFVEMFGDPVTNQYNLETEQLANLGYLGRGVSKHRPRNAPELLGGRYPLIQTGDVANANIYIKEYNSTYSEIGYKQSKMWNTGTLCITIAANIAKTAILTFDSCFPDSVVGFNAGDRVNNLYMHYWFTFFQKILEEQAPESAQKNINLKILSDLEVMVPLIELQNQFADFVQQVDKSKVTI